MPQVPLRLARPTSARTDSRSTCPSQQDVRFATLVMVGDVDSQELADARPLHGCHARPRPREPPGEGQAPAAMADIASGLSLDVAVTVYGEDDIIDRGFGGLAAVNAGADRPARMVVMEYRPDGAEATVAFVGKGIVFDSGGLSIKPPQRWSR